MNSLAETASHSRAAEECPWKTGPDTIRTWPVARTNVQLYNQLLDQGRPLKELVLVRDAYHLAMRLYAGKYGSDCAAFITHPVGVASIMAGLGYATEYVATAVVHNIYRNADWGDGRGPGNWPARRVQAIEYIGAEVEKLLSRFSELRIRRDSFPALLEKVGQMNARDSALLSIEVADYWEKYCELAVTYYGVERWDITLAEQHRNDLVELSRRLGHHTLADILDDAIGAAAARQIPVELRGATRWSRMTLAPSLMMRPKVQLLLWLRRVHRKARALSKKWRP